MNTSYVSTVDVTVSTSIERILNRTLLLPVNTPYLTFSTLLFCLLNAYLLWENQILRVEYMAGTASQFESFIFYVISTCACVLLIFLSFSKDVLEENHRLNEPFSFTKITSAVLTWSLLATLCIPTLQLYGNPEIQSYITEHPLSVLDFIPKKTPFYSSSW